MNQTAIDIIRNSIYSKGINSIKTVNKVYIIDGPIQPNRIFFENQGKTIP